MNETGLPGVDFGRAMGTAVGFSFFSHSIYGGGGQVSSTETTWLQGTVRASLPCVAAAMCLDAYSDVLRGKTSGLIGSVYSEIDYFREPIVNVAKGAAEIKDQL